MKYLRVALFVFTATGLTFPLAKAGVLYDNTTSQSGTLTGISIYTGVSQTFSDSFTLATDSTVGGITFESWQLAGNSISTVEWEISSGPLGQAFSGTVYGTGTATTSDTLLCTACAGSGYDLNDDSISISDLALSEGTYYLTLFDAVANGEAFWDMSDGASTAYTGASFFGPLDLAAPTDGSGYFSIAGSESETFQILDNSGSATPEPSTLLLMGSSVALASIFRRRKAKVG
jgi:hypothetical protein